MRPTATREEVDGVRRTVEEHGLEAFLSVGEERTVIGVVGKDIDRVAHLGTLPGVEQVIRISSPYKLASSEHQVEPTRVRVNGVELGLGQELVVMAGPCAVESREQLFDTARTVKREGARVLRGGAFKPRTSPYSFQGLGMPALELLAEAHREFGLPVISEVVDPADVPAFEELVDILQVGARNMHNFVLLRAVGQSRRPVLLKRGLSATIEEWLLAAEYILSAGNPNVILCERGIRTFETATRNTLDLSAVPVLRSRTHLPIIVDPSHGTGHRALVAPMALAGAAVGADGLIIEVHPDPANARSDGDQSLSFEEFGALMDELRRLQFVRSADAAPAPAPATTEVVGDVRDRIDDLDARLAEMVQERASLALEVMRRRDAGAHGHDVRRERELLERAASGTTGPMTPVELTMVFDALLRASRSVQRRHAQSVTEAEAAAAGHGR
ncbi:MAG: bifunctional 3-deoxy-7-phosphoheptulonate synthase/chorismate mutase [Candidatus Limnocylindria bacterium]